MSIKNTINIININVQSVTNKINQINLILHDLEIDLMCMTEHWLTEEKLLSTNITNYYIGASFSRKQYIHGGVLILVNKKILTKSLNIDKLSQEKHVEMCGILLSEFESIIIATYRSPHGCENIFFETIDSLLDDLLKNYPKHNIFLIGDFNINILQYTTSTEKLLNLMLENGLHQVYSEPSRITKTTNTCIDNIFTNINLDLYEAKTINLHLADHQAQLLNITITAPRAEKQVKTIRRVNRENINRLKYLLDRVNWNVVYNSEYNAQEAYTKFHNILIESMDIACPREISIVPNEACSKTTKKCENLEKMQNQLDAIYTIITATKQFNMMEMYKNLKEQYKREVDNERKLINSRLIIEAQDKLKATWRIINQEIGKNQKKIKNESKLTASEFNKYFAEIGGIESTDVGTENPLENIKRNPVNSMFMPYVTTMETTDIIRKLKNKTTKDIYDLTPMILKQIEEQISTTLTYTINKAIKEGIFPNELKLAKIIPIFKKGDVDECSNYRPISILPVISKVFEKVFNEKITNYLENNLIITKDQHGYRKNRSTITAIAGLVQRISEAFDNREYAQVLFCDLSKAFDTVDHKILMDKIWRIGLRGLIYTFIKSYLQNRKQLVSWNGEVSDRMVVGTGVPQGSVLGPLLFIIYINDLSENVTAKSVYIFADDTTLLNTDQDIDNLKLKTANSLEEATRWFHTNHLTINKDKTQTLTLYTAKNMDIQPQKIKFLGLYLSETLTWKNHIEETKKKLNRAIYRIKIISKNVTEQAARLTYFADFHSIATYGILLWGVSSSMGEVFRLQRRAIRVLCGVHFQEDCKPLFRSRKIMTIPSTFILTSLMYMHTNKGNATRNLHYHDYNTRGNNNLVVPYHRVNKSQHTTNYLAVKFYNRLPTRLQELNTSQFKKTIRNLLIEKAYYSTSEYMEEKW